MPGGGEEGAVRPFVAYMNMAMQTIGGVANTATGAIDEIGKTYQTAIGAMKEALYVENPGFHRRMITEGDKMYERRKEMMELQLSAAASGSQE